jgi:hypothetical protein
VYEAGRSRLRVWRVAYVMRLLLLVKAAQGTAQCDIKLTGKGGGEEMQQICP